jgi:pimeloyl-ACP methyl ester carboxylesterase
VATFVLVHGAWGGGWEWREVARRLQRDGHEVSRVTLTGLGERSHLLTPDVDLDLHVQDVVAHLEFDDLRDVILVGHSYGGMVVTGAAERAPDRIAQLVYVDAFVPQDGESVLDLVPGAWASEWRAAARDGAVPPPEDPSYPPWYIARARPHPLAAFEKPLRIEGRSSGIPRSYVRCLRSVVPLEPIAERIAGWPRSDIDTAHDAQVDDPQRLAELLSRAAAAT